MRAFAVRVGAVLNDNEVAFAYGQVSQSPVVPAPRPAPVAPQILAATLTPEPPRGYSSYEGFKSYARGGALSIDDIVKGLSRHHKAVAEHSALVKASVEPIYENVEPVYEDVEPINGNAEAITKSVESEADIRGFAAALVGGDRAAVFAGLRQHIRGNGAPESLLSKTACFIDDAYRARIDGTACDTDIARLVARLDTPTLEKLVAALTTAIDSSYSTGATGAKLALTRALAVLGA